MLCPRLIFYHLTVFAFKKCTCNTTAPLSFSIIPVFLLLHTYADDPTNLYIEENDSIKPYLHIYCFFFFSIFNKSPITKNPIAKIT